MLCQTESINKGLERSGTGPGTKRLLSQGKVSRRGEGEEGKVETGGGKSVRAVQVN